MNLPDHCNPSNCYFLLGHVFEFLEDSNRWRVLLDEEDYDYVDVETAPEAMPYWSNTEQTNEEYVHELNDLLPKTLLEAGIRDELIRICCEREYDANFSMLREFIKDGLPGVANQTDEELLENARYLCDNDTGVYIIDGFEILEKGVKRIEN